MDEGGKGHDPTEDAVAALELAQYFINAGPWQVTHAHAHAHTWWQCWVVHFNVKAVSDVIFSPPQMCAPLCQVVALHLEKLWGYKLEEEKDSDPSAGPAVSQRYGTHQKSSR